MLLVYFVFTYIRAGLQNSLPIHWIKSRFRYDTNLANYLEMYMVYIYVYDIK